MKLTHLGWISICAVLILNACATVGAIKPAPDTKSFMDVFVQEMESVGFRLVDRKDDRVVLEHEKTFKMNIRYLPDSQRLFYLVLYALKDGETCKDPILNQKMRKANEEFNIGKLTCIENDNVLVYEGVILVPQGGFNPTEVRDYFIYLSQSFVDMVAYTDLEKHLQ